MQKSLILARISCKVVIFAQQSTKYMERLYEEFNLLIKKVPMDFIRYKYDEIEWDGRMLGVVGPRGVGKTTMLLQYIKKNLPLNESLYVAVDSIYFANNTLSDTVDKFVKNGGKYLFIDEIHKYDNWSKELKHIYDIYEDLKIVFSGSSILDIYKGASDLSRRAPIYEMQGLSFREYLKLFHNVKIKRYSLDEILTHKVELSGIEHPLPLFEDYLHRGYYPFGRNKDFNVQLEQVITQTMEWDIPKYAELNISVGRKLTQLLLIISKSAPFKPSYQQLAEMLGTSRNYIADYMLYMERAGMLSQLRAAAGGIRGLGKVEKVFLDNTNLMYNLSNLDANVGNVRETFFYNQMRVNHNVKSSSISDFVIDDITFEVGGRKKGKKQIENITNAFVVRDNIEMGFQNFIPLWAFGLNY